jgi:electron transport complex protein RnfD
MAVLLGEVHDLGSLGFGNVAGEETDDTVATVVDPEHDLGGLYLIYAGIIRWHIPLAVLAGLLLPATLLYLLDAARFASPGFHLFSGAKLLGAFFIATDPVSAAATVRGRLIYGAAIGVLTYAIRTWGGYPDGIAFAVLLMNGAVPLIDRYTRPRVFGQRDA